jgi:hypothetical protein
VSDLNQKPIFPKSFTDSCIQQALEAHETWSESPDWKLGASERLLYDQRFTKIWADLSLYIRNDTLHAMYFWTCLACIQKWDEFDKRLKVDKAREIGEIQKFSQKLKVLIEKPHNKSLLLLKKKKVLIVNYARSLKTNDKEEQILNTLSKALSFLETRCSEVPDQFLEKEASAPQSFNSTEAFRNYLIDELNLMYKKTTLHFSGNPDEKTLKRHNSKVRNLITEIVYIISDQDPGENVRERASRFKWSRYFPEVFKKMKT